MINNRLKKDLNHIFHPCMQMKLFETVPLLSINSADGIYLDTQYGLIIDAISSWWCKPLGHRHPSVQQAIQESNAKTKKDLGIVMKAIMKINSDIDGKQAKEVASQMLCN